MKHVFRFFLIFALIGVFGVSYGAEKAKTVVSTEKTTSVIGASKCNECHEEMVGSFGESSHAKEWAAKYGSETGTCERCHGSASEHVTANSKETIIGFSKKSPKSAKEKSAQCLACHKNQPTLAYWAMGPHQKNDVTCADCHATHKGKEFAKPTAETCFTCHKDMKAAFKKSSHHPVVEGLISCNDCHNPHGTLSHGNIVAENINQLCYKCHGDKRGPFLW